MTLTDDVLQRLKAALGPEGWSEEADRIAPKLVEWRDRWSGSTPILLLPRSTAEVSAALAICHAAGVAVTPQGGNTGLVAGQIPQGEVLLSLERMRALRDVDGLDDVIVAEAGVVLTTVQRAALSIDRFFPLSLAAEGSATVGGLISTNAGGTGVLRYGVMRDLVLGLEVVLPNGEVFDGLKRLRKNNTGYDLKQLFIGAEGTLGVITAACLRLFAVMTSRATAMVGLRSAHDAIALLATAKTLSGGQVEAFELIGRLGVDNVMRHVPNVREPLEDIHPWYVLIEIASSEPGAADAALERILEDALARDLMQDAAVAQNQAQAQALWKIREEMSAAQKAEGVCWKLDISTPISKVADFITEATAAVEARYPGSRVVAFGHVGDGNTHFDVLQPIGEGDLHERHRDEGSHMINDIADRMGGSISAEHGLGSMKAREALGYKSATEARLLRQLRDMIDPARTLNPRVLF
jgi:FAD/FMN-containing dehydrogenase